MNTTQKLIMIKMSSLCHFEDLNVQKECQYSIPQLSFRWTVPTGYAHSVALIADIPYVALEGTST